MQTHYSEQQLQSLLSKVRIFNSQIGDYRHHTPVTAYEYIVRLTNGSICLSVEELEADHNRTLTPELLTTISERFQPARVSVYFREEEEQDVPSSQAGRLQEDRKSRIKSWIVLVIIVLVIIAAGILVSRVLKSSATGTHADNRPLVTLAAETLYHKTEAELLADLRSQELENPIKYLSISWDTRKNARLQQVFEGSIYNESNMTGFMNIRVRISGYSKTDYLLDERDYVVTEFIDPGNTRSFEWPSEGWPSGICRFEARIIRVECY